MASFGYKAMDREGRETAGRIDAPGRSEAIADLARREVYVTEIGEEGEGRRGDTETRRRGEEREGTGAGGAGGFRFWRRGRVKPRVHAAMLRQLATALQAGLPLLSALQVVREQAEAGGLRELTEDLAARVQGGESLSEAMGRHPKQFSRLEVSMVRVGETAGLLDQVMGYLSDFAERDAEIREKVRSASAYPLFVLGLAAVSVTIVVTAILPRVVGSVTEGMKASTLPGPTRALLAVSAALTGYGWLIGLAIVGVVAGFRYWVSRPAGRLAFDGFKLRIPVLGTALRRVAVARFARTLGTLSKSGIEILEALRVLRDTLGNEALACSIDRVAADIRQGRSIAEPLRQTGQFPPLLIQVIAMGERTGRLDELLLKTADAYEKETAAAIGRTMALLPAVLIVVLALIVAFILAAVLLPIVGMELTPAGL